MVLPVIRSDEDPHVSMRLQRARPIGTSFADTILASGHVPHRKAGHTTARRGGSSSQNCLAKSGAFTHETDAFVAWLTDGERLVLTAELLGEDGEGVEAMTVDVSDMSDDEYREFLIGSAREH